MNAKALQTWLSSSEPPLLVQVLPEEIFQAQRIPGSQQACVYEVAFLDQINAISPDRQRSLVVYGAGGGSLDAATALEKLKQAGYNHVHAFEGGLDEWVSEGLALEGTGSLPESTRLTGTYKVDAEQSIIRWTGRNLFNHHSGTVRLASGEIVLKESQLVSAQFRIAMNSIQCEDISDSAMNQMLIAHLQSPDFFEVPRYPEAEFIADHAEPLHSCTDGTPNHWLKGRFTLRGITREIEFPILVATNDGQRLTAQGVLDLDRTQFGSHYGSGRLFRFLGKHIVNDHIHLHLKIHADLQA